MNPNSFSPPSSSSSSNRNSARTTTRGIFFAIAFSAFAASFFQVAAKADPTNILSDAEIEGRGLARKILERMAESATDLTNTATLQIHRDHKTMNLFLTVTTTVKPNNCQVDYEARTNAASAPMERLKIIQSKEQPGIYYTSQRSPGMIESGVFDARLLRGNETMIPFAGSDFWLCDFGLEFFRWPAQKVLKKEFHRQCPCVVLESTNPVPTPGGYSRVVSWIDEESLGIVEACAYDANGKELKNFYPKDFQKVNGQYQVQSLIIVNTQTDSRSRLEFDLKK